MTRISRAAALALPAIVTLAGAAPVHAQASLPPFMELRVPKPPTVATAETGSFLVYELHVTNFATQTMTLKQVDVVTADANQRVLLALADSILARSITKPGAAAVAMTPVERPKLAGGTRAVVFLWVPVEGNNAPRVIRHRLTLAQGDSGRITHLDGPAVPVASNASVIGPPLRGGPWLTGNGPAPETGHRRALIPVNGVPAIAQRFAIDYVKLGDDYRTFTGDRLKNENYHAYGTDALAVADGMVVATKDSIPENVPGPASRAVPITLETVGGNHVIIDIGNGHYAFYAHLQPGSLRVRLGERVRRGQVVGLVGNSGNSTEPHLHFHISDGTSPLASEGVPYALESFDLIGHCRTFNTGCVNNAAVVRRREQPLGSVLIRFPQ